MATIIISAAQLTTFLRYPVTDPVSQESAELAERVALGWLSEATGIDEWDWDSHKESSTVFAWVLELTGIAYENPTSMSQDGAGDVQSSWVDRRKQILESAKAWALRRSPSAGVTSRGSFPPAARWPEPARGPW